MTLETYKKQKDYLICVDSDGCIIDGMTIKHLTCFGPGIIEVYQLKQYEEELISFWNKANLYSRTRGINRFKGLIMILKYAIEKEYYKESVDHLAYWVEHTDELSNQSLQREIDKLSMENIAHDDLDKAMEWSLWVNSHVAQLASDQKKAFVHASSALKAANQVVDVVVVSSANRQAVLNEFKENDVDSYVHMFMTQEYGTKADCLKQLRLKGYEADHILMIGDAPGDIASAKEAGVSYYPIIPSKEEMVWEEFEKEILQVFVLGQYSQDQMNHFEQRYFEYLDQM